MLIWTGTDNQVQMEPSATLTKSQRIEFDKLKLTCTQSFAYDSLGCGTISKHEIILESRVPIFSHPYRKSIKERQLLQIEVKKLLDALIIRSSRSSYASPVILVPKKEKSIRMCVDYRRLRKVTVSEQWPLPRIDDILDGLLSGSPHWILNLVTIKLR